MHAERFFNQREYVRGPGLEAHYSASALNPRASNESDPPVCGHTVSAFSGWEGFFFSGRLGVSIMESRSGGLEHVL